MITNAITTQTTTYTAEIEIPKNDKEGLMNFVQMIINEIEAGNTNEALLKAVDLRNDLNGCLFSWIDPNAAAIGEAEEAQEPAQVTQLVPENKENLNTAYYRNSYWI